jgi:RNA polymerase sigma factor (sigma-70 family)
VAEPDGHPPADTAVLLAEEHQAVIKAVRRLPRRQQEVLVLRYWANLSEAEIAETLGVSRGTVKTCASRALATLGDRLS